MFRRAAGTLLLAAGAGAATLAGGGRGDTGPPIKVMTRHPWPGDPRCRPGGGGGRGRDGLLEAGLEHVLQPAGGAQAESLLTD